MTWGVMFHSHPNVQYVAHPGLTVCESRKSRIDWKKALMNINGIGSSHQLADLSNVNVSLEIPSGTVYIGNDGPQFC